MGGYSVGGSDYVVFAWRLGTGSSTGSRSSHEFRLPGFWFVVDSLVLKGEWFSLRILDHVIL